MLALDCIQVESTQLERMMPRAIDRPGHLHSPTITPNLPVSRQYTPPETPRVQFGPKKFFEKPPQNEALWTQK